MPTKPILKIRHAAAYFALVSRHAATIANHFDVSTRTIHRWADDPEWQQTLDFLNIDEDQRSFEIQPYRDVDRESGDLVENARQIYQKAIREGHPPHKWVRITADTTGLSTPRIRNWAKRFGWEKD